MISSQLGSACPLSLFCALQVHREESGSTPLRVLLVHGLSDADVPASQALSFAEASWSAPERYPCWLLLLQEADHYVVAGLGVSPEDRIASNSHWPTIAAALRAFVAESDQTLNSMCCTTAGAARPLADKAMEVCCARRTLASILTLDSGFVQWAADEPASAQSLVRGLRRWFSWVGETPLDAVREWLDSVEADGSA